MDFIYITSINGKELDSKKVHIDLCEGQFIIRSTTSIYAFRKGAGVFFQNNNCGILLSGRVRVSHNTDEESLLLLYKTLINNNWPLASEFSGCFSGLAVFENNFYIFNDPLGLYKLYYTISDNLLIVTTNLSSLKNLINCKLNFSSLILELTGPEYIQYSNRTVLKDVYTLMPGELVKFSNGEISRKFDISIKYEDKIAGKGLAEHLVNLINEEFKEYYSRINDFTISLSGGIDSRILLAPFIASKGKRIKITNYGSPEYIDTKIPISIARSFNYPIEIINPIPYSFPDIDKVRSVIKETDAFHVNYWLGHLFTENPIGKGEFLLLGDMCDILRAKGISSLRTRSFRKSYYLKKILFKQDLRLNRINTRNKQEFIDLKRQQLIKQIKNNLSLFRNININEQQIIDEVEEDLYSLFFHIDKYNFDFIESYEELFGIFSHGRKSMGKQLNILKHTYLPEIPLLNIRITREVLNYSPEVRFGDELTHLMFKNTQWKALGDFPTAQNPFNKYNIDYRIMLLGWYLRSSIDQMLTKRYVSTRGKFKKQRLYKNLDSQLAYAFPGSVDNFKKYFKSEIINPENLIEVFESRRDLLIWPHSPIDLTPFIQAEYYLQYFS